eukprot:2547893-Rhodomonas_salina.1
MSVPTGLSTLEPAPADMKYTDRVDGHGPRTCEQQIVLPARCAQEEQALGARSSYLRVCNLLQTSHACIGRARASGVGVELAVQLQHGRLGSIHRTCGACHHLGASCEKGLPETKRRWSAHYRLNQVQPSVDVHRPQRRRRSECSVGDRKIVGDNQVQRPAIARLERTHACGPDSRDALPQFKGAVRPFEDWRVREVVAAGVVKLKIERKLCFERLEQHEGELGVTPHKNFDGNGQERRRSDAEALQIVGPARGQVLIARQRWARVGVEGVHCRGDGIAQRLIVKEISYHKQRLLHSAGARHLDPCPIDGAVCRNTLQQAEVTCADSELSDPRTPFRVRHQDKVTVIDGHVEQIQGHGCLNGVQQLERGIRHDICGCESGEDLDLQPLRGQLFARSAIRGLDNNSNRCRWPDRNDERVGGVGPIQSDSTECEAIRASWVDGQ